VVPVGSEITGRVDTVRPAAKGGKPGQIDVSFVQVRLPNGRTRAINGSLADLDSDDAKSDTEGTASGDRMKHRKVIFIGGGGAGGAVLGGAIGGGKGALIGAIIGAGAGYVGDRYTKGEEAEVRSGTQFSIYLNQAFSMPRYTETGDDRQYDPEPIRPGSGRTYRVQPGDTLGKISMRFYGTTREYMRIYEANRDRLRSPSSIEVGQELIIP
jgi:nucleoid-associated protein YgaU